VLRNIDIHDMIFYVGIGHTCCGLQSLHGKAYISGAGEIFGQKDLSLWVCVHQDVIFRKTGGKICVHRRQFSGFIRGEVKIGSVGVEEQAGKKSIRIAANNRGLGNTGLFLYINFSSSVCW